MWLARLGEQMDVDLWNFQTDDGRSIRQATDYLLPFAVGDTKWSYQQLGGWNPGGFSSILRQAAAKYSDDRYSTALAKLRGGNNNGGGWRELLR